MSEAIKNNVAAVGMICILIGIVTMLAGEYLMGFGFLLLGMVIAVVIMFWGFSGKFTDIIDKHTGVYSDKSEKPQKEKQRRKW